MSETTLGAGLPALVIGTGRTTAPLPAWPLDRGGAPDRARTRDGHLGLGAAPRSLHHLPHLAACPAVRDLVRSDGGGTCARPGGAGSAGRPDREIDRGAIALHLAAARPDLVKRLVLVITGATLSANGRTAGRTVPTRTSRPADVRSAYRDMYGLGATSALRRAVMGAIGWTMGPRLSPPPDDPTIILSRARGLASLRRDADRTLGRLSYAGDRHAAGPRVPDRATRTISRPASRGARP